MNRRLRIAVLLLSAVPAAAQAQTTRADSTLMVDLPPGHGTLNQDFITVHFTVGALDIRFMPIGEPMIRLLAPDGYKAINALVASQQTVIDSIARSRGIARPGVVLLTLYATAPNTRFDPRQFTMTLQNRRLEPVGLIPLSTEFSNQQLALRQRATGLLIFAQAPPPSEIFTVTYNLVTNRDWETMIPRLEAERIRIVGKVKHDSLMRKPS